MAMRGIYIVANDKVLDNTIALLNSIRQQNSEIPIYLIPFNQDYQRLLQQLTPEHGVELFPDLALLDRLDENLGNIFDRDFLALPNKMRKLAAWFGPLDEFLYIDTDIVIFDDLDKVISHLQEADFLCCDYHFSGEKLRNVFSKAILDLEVFSERELEDVFNSGFWGSRKGILTEAQLYQTFREAAAHREYFDFSEGVTDQPLLNFLILRHFERRVNLAKPPVRAPGSWAGSKHFRARENLLYDKGDRRLLYLHWAGIKIERGCPYWKLWSHYRHLHSSKGGRTAQFAQKIARLWSATA
jgi:hypothetical protein